MADSMAKTVNGQQLSVRRFLLTSYFRIGFPGRRVLSEQKEGSALENTG